MTHEVYDWTMLPSGVMFQGTRRECRREAKRLNRLFKTTVYRVREVA